jgi:hypothetical protein
MSKPLMLSIGKDVPHETAAPEPAVTSESPVSEPSSAAAGTTAAPGGDSLAEIYETVKRHEETLRDLIVEIRLLYHNLSDKEKQRLEARRDAITREVRDNCAGQIRSLEEKILRLRGSR